jgi:hypothetical protein
VTADRDIAPGKGVWNMVKDGKSIGWNAFTLAGVKSASDFGEMPAAGAAYRRHRTASPAIPAISPAQLLRSPEVLACSPAQLSGSPGHLAGSPGQLSLSPAHFAVSPGDLGRSPGRLDAPDAPKTAYFEKFRHFQPFAAG